MHVEFKKIRPRLDKQLISENCLTIVVIIFALISWNQERLINLTNHKFNDTNFKPQCQTNESS